MWSLSYVVCDTDTITRMITHTAAPAAGGRADPDRRRPPPAGGRPIERIGSYVVQRTLRPKIDFFSPPFRPECDLTTERGIGSPPPFSAYFRHDPSIAVASWSGSRTDNCRPASPRPARHDYALVTTVAVRPCRAARMVVRTSRTAPDHRPLFSASSRSLAVASCTARPGDVLFVVFLMRPQG